jgi:peptidoglycan/xylan/chitin deacetylase (PgdA/CDA1 family)
MNGQISGCAAPHDLSASKRRSGSVMTMSRAVPILLYHRIAVATSSAMRRFSVGPTAFDAQLRYLKTNGFAGLTVSDFVNFSQHRPDMLPEKPIVLTFDDAFADFYTEAAPLLSVYGFPATLYVVAGQLNGTSSWLSGDDSRLPLLDDSQLIELQQMGIEIGAHGMTHRALDGLDNTALRNEIEQSKDRLEQCLNAPVESFAYPFGFCSDRVRRQVMAAGYSSACAVRYETSSTIDNPFDLARHIVPGGVGISDFAKIADGHPPLPALLWDRLRSRAGSIARRAVARSTV